ncbi:MAG: hypothetical protein MZU97_05310 [Bacillus subtilis]|nr:hypothetical protein [Bacillus subtilis]
MAEACNADKAYFLTNGTTVGILAMIMATGPRERKDHHAAQRP